jgi:hypothetical protein
MTPSTPAQQQSRYIYIPNIVGRQIVCVLVNDNDQEVDDVTFEIQPIPDTVRPLSIASPYCTSSTSTPSSSRPQTPV